MILCFLIELLVAYIRADIPAACDPDGVNGINGTWNFYVGPAVDRIYNCSSIDIGTIAGGENFTVNIAIDDDNSHNVYSNGTLVGHWSSMDTEGFDVFINDLHYQAYFSFTEAGVNENNETCYVTNCSQTLGGWRRSNIIHPDDFHCFYAEKIDGPPVEDNCTVFKRLDSEMLSASSKHRIGRRYKKPYRVKPARSSSTAKNISSFPLSLDWSNFNGLNYVNPVYDQEFCGSCFAFGTLSALESRILINSARAVDVSLSQQDIVSCSHYSQGCEGGFETEVGYWIKDHGIVDNKCFPYHYYARATSTTPDCSVRCEQGDFAANTTTTTTTATVDHSSLSAGRGRGRGRVGDDLFGGSTSLTGTLYASDVSYIGGYHGGCTEALMIEALQDGPIPVGIDASAPEFDDPAPGSIIDSNDNQSIDHTVLLVGYGEENGVLFWKIKNSWGVNWGDSGFARIRRGNNTLQIESDATVINPVPYESSNSDSKTLTSREKAILAAGIAAAGLFVIAVIVLIVLTLVYCSLKGKYKHMNNDD